MGRPPGRRARAVLTRRRVAAAVCAALLGAAAPAAAAVRWDVTMALRLTPANGGAVSVRVALPPSDARQRLDAVKVVGRGLKAEIVRDGSEPHVRLTGRLTSPRRIAVSYEVTRVTGSAPLPPIVPIEAPPAALRPYLTPSPLFQSRSLLVRDFLETHVSPLLDAPGSPDLARSVLQVTRERLTLTPDGRSLTLDVLRSGRGKRIGIERAFTTFLRCAGVPARFVEGLDLTSTTRRKRVFWTEAWAQDAWWPISASAGWVGRQPRAWIALARDGQRVLRVDGPASVTYTVQAVSRQAP